jgi:hypothetical protein
MKIELGSKKAESYYNLKGNSINNDCCQQVYISTLFYKFATCKCGNNCVDNATHGITVKLRESNWGA